jgi:hypothetical protein
MVAVIPVATMSKFTSWSRCSVGDVLAGWLNKVAPVYLPRESEFSSSPEVLTRESLREKPTATEVLTRESQREPERET